MFAVPPSILTKSASITCALALAGTACADVSALSRVDATLQATGVGGDGAGEAAAGDAAPLTLDAVRWQRRLIVAFGDDAAELSALERLVEENACRLDERETDVYRVTSEAVVPLSPGAARLDDAARDALAALARGTGRSAGRGDDDEGRTSATADAPFELVLVGKDGGVKGRAPVADALPDFLDEIDGMPMRRAEVARGTDGCR